MARAGRRDRSWLAPPVIAATAAALMVAVAVAYGLPIRDPDARLVGSPLAFIGVIGGVFWLLDVVPRSVRRWRRDDARLPDVTAAVIRERWSGRRALVALLALASFYVTYVSYRNLKSFLPFVRPGEHDLFLLELDRWMLFGQDPGPILHDLLGTGLSAAVLSAVYLGFLTFVPISLGVAVIWSRRMRPGLWYVTALSIDWLLGAASYYALPALGPIYAAPELFSSLPATGVSALQDSLLTHRSEVLADPHATNAVQSIAAFASLHVAIVFTAALIAQILSLRRAVRVTLWTFVALTVVSTVYFGWHYVIDDVAGVGIAVVATYVAARATGFEWRPLAGRAAPAQRTAEAT